MIDKLLDEYTCVEAQAVRYVSDSYPGFAECHMTDIHGRELVFIEKVLFLISYTELGKDSPYPVTVGIVCDVIRRENGVAYINTEDAFDTETVEGEFEFEVPEEKIFTWLRKTRSRKT